MDINKLENNKINSLINKQINQNDIIKALNSEKDLYNVCNVIAKKIYKILNKNKSNNFINENVDLLNKIKFKILYKIINYLNNKNQLYQENLNKYAKIFDSIPIPISVIKVLNENDEIKYQLDITNIKKYNTSDYDPNNLFDGKLIFVYDTKNKNIIKQHGLYKINNLFFKKNNNINNLLEEVNNYLLNISNNGKVYKAFIKNNNLIIKEFCKIDYIDKNSLNNAINTKNIVQWDRPGREKSSFQYKWLRLVSTYIPNKYNNEDGIIITACLNITDLKRYEQIIKNMCENNTTGLGLIITDENNNILNISIKNLISKQISNDYLPNNYNDILEQLLGKDIKNKITKLQKNAEKNNNTNSTIINTFIKNSEYIKNKHLQIIYTPLIEKHKYLGCYILLIDITPVLSIKEKEQELNKIIAEKYKTLKEFTNWLTYIISLKDNETAYHSYRVQAYSFNITKEYLLNILENIKIKFKNKKEIEEIAFKKIAKIILSGTKHSLSDYFDKIPKNVYELINEYSKLISYVSPLHDIGKIGIPDNILLKNGKLNNEEYEIIKTHTTIYDDNNHTKNPIIKLTKTIARSHHERWDGKGYPDRLQEDKIPFPARILSIADVIDAKTSSRVYKKSEEFFKSIESICNEAGTAFDPDIIKVVNKIKNKLFIIKIVYDLYSLINIFKINVNIKPHEIVYQKNYTKLAYYFKQKILKSVDKENILKVIKEIDLSINVENFLFND